MSGLRSYEEAYRHIVGKMPESDADPERVAAARMAAGRSSAFRKQGWECREWRAGPKRPWFHKEGSLWQWDTPYADHPYRLVQRSTGRELFIFEPYDLGDDYMPRLAEIRERGWEVRISAGWALHYPGRTVAVSLERKGPATRGAPVP